MNTTYDAIIVGAGPAGSTAAILLAAAGWTVALVEKQPFPRRKVCGACLNGRAVGALRGVGLGGLIDELGAVPLDRFRLRGWGRSADVRLRAGVVLSRESFDAALVGEAVTAGCNWIPGCRAVVDSVTPERASPVPEAGGGDPLGTDA